MRCVDVASIVQAVAAMCIKMNYNIGSDVLDAFYRFKETESSVLGQQIISDLISNSQIAETKQLPLCQDTGMVVAFVTLGQGVQISGGLLTDAIQEGVRQGYREGYLRKSVVSDPINRINTQDNTPAIIHLELVEGDQLVIHLAAKGFGSENMSQIKMMTPADDLTTIEAFVLDVVRQAGSNPCPPIIVGIGIGGNFEKCAYLAKYALLRQIGQRHPEPLYAEFENRLLDAINALGIGPQGLGGTTTALDVFVETYPTHIAGLPVAVNINCHSSRHLTCIL